MRLSWNWARPGRRLVGLAVMLCLLLGASLSVHAADAPMAPWMKERTRAIDLAKAGKWKPAAESFEKAYLGGKDAANLFDAGVAWDKAGEPTKASLAFQRYVSAAPTGPKVARARELIAALKPRVTAAAGLGTLVITTENPGAAVTVDGVGVGTAPLSVDVAVGEHTVFVSLGGYLGYTAPVTISAGEMTTLTVKLDRDPGATAMPTPTPTGAISGTGGATGSATGAITATAPPPGGSKSKTRVTDKWWFWAAVGGGAAVVVTIVIIAAVPAPFNDVPPGDLGLQEFRR